MQQVKAKDVKVGEQFWIDEKTVCIRILSTKNEEIKKEDIIKQDGTKEEFLAVPYLNLDFPTFFCYLPIEHTVHVTDR